MSDKLKDLFELRASTRNGFMPYDYFEEEQLRDSLKDSPRYESSSCDLWEAEEKAELDRIKRIRSRNTLR